MSGVDFGRFPGVVLVLVTFRAVFEGGVTASLPTRGVLAGAAAAFPPLLLFA